MDCGSKYVWEAPGTPGRRRGYQAQISTLRFTGKNEIPQSGKKKKIQHRNTKVGSLRAFV